MLPLFVFISTLVFVSFGLTHRTHLWNPSAPGGNTNNFFVSNGDEISGIEWGVVDRYSSIVITQVTTRNGDVFSSFGTWAIDSSCNTIELDADEHINAIFVYAGVCDTTSGVPCNFASFNFVRSMGLQSSRGRFFACSYTRTRVDPPTPWFNVDMTAVTDNARLTGILSKTGDIIDAIGFEFTYEAISGRGCTLSAQYPPNANGGSPGNNIFQGDIQLIEWGILNSFSSVIISSYDGSGDSSFAIGRPDMIDNPCDSVSLVEIYQSEVVISIDTWAGTCTSCNYGSHNFVRGIRLHTNLGRQFECIATQNAQKTTYPTSTLGVSVSLEGFEWRDGYITDGIKYQMCYFSGTPVTQTFTVNIEFGGSTGTMSRVINLIDERAPFGNTNALKLAAHFLGITTNIGDFGSLNGDLVLNGIGTNGNTRWNWYLNNALSNEDANIDDGQTLTMRYES